MKLIHSSAALLVFNQQKLFHPLGCKQNPLKLVFIHLINTKLTQNCCQKTRKRSNTRTNSYYLQLIISTGVFQNMLHLFSPRLINTFSTGVLRFSIF